MKPFAKIMLMTNQNNTSYIFPSTASDEEQFHYVATLMDMIEDEMHGELLFAFAPKFKGYLVEIFEHEEGSEDEWENHDGLELVEWYDADTIKDVFDFLERRFL